MKLDIRKWYGKIIPRKYFQDRCEWTSELEFPFMGEIIIRTSRELSWENNQPVLTLKQVYENGSDQRKHTQHVHLTSTECNYGGERWWFICPLCYRHCACLYMLRWQQFYRCRKCNDLTYRSVQEAHKSDRGAKLFGIDLSAFDRAVAYENLVDRWYKKEHLTQRERRKIAEYLGLPLFMIRNKFYKRGNVIG